MPDGMTASSNGTSLQKQEIGLIQERALPSSPSPLYSSHSKASSFMKGGLGQPSTRKQLIGGQGVVDNSRGLLQLVQSISFVSLSIDHSLQLMIQADSTSHGTIPYNSSLLFLFFFSDYLFSDRVDCGFLLDSLIYNMGCRGDTKII